MANPLLLLSLLACTTASDTGAPDPTDSDGDGVSSEAGDCDDGDAAVHPGADERCNGVDDDCDGDVDEEAVDASPSYPDADGDGFGDESAGVSSCAPPSGHIALGGDCDDTSDVVYPGAPELCDGRQNDCSTPWTEDAVVSFTDASGATRDVSPDFTSGADGAPYEVIWEEDGRFDFCTGTYYVAITSRADQLAITGHGSESTTLSAGGEDRVLFVQASDATVDLEGFTLTGGSTCYGAAIGVQKVNGCSESSASAGAEHRGLDLTLTDVRVTGNHNINGRATITLYEGSLSLVDSAVHGNQGYTVFLEDSGFTCTGSASNDAGVWGNEWEGVEISLHDHATPREVWVDTCDFGEGQADNPYTDFIIDHWGTGGGADVRAEYGDDVSFSCDTTVPECS